MYDEEDKLFKMWARAGSDAAAGYVGGNAAFMLYFTSADGQNPPGALASRPAPAST